MLARAQTPHIFVLKSLFAVHLFNTLYQPLSKSRLALFFSKPRAKIRLFMRVGVEKLTKKQHNFLLDKKLCFLIVPIDAVGSIDAIVSIFLFPLLIRFSVGTSLSPAGATIARAPTDNHSFAAYWAKHSCFIGLHLFHHLSGHLLQLV